MGMMLKFRWRGLAASFGRWLDGGGRQLRLGSMPTVTPPRDPRPLELNRSQAVVVPPAADLSAPKAQRIDRRLLATAFDSSHPVRSPSDLFGRDRELEQLLASALDFRQHSVVHGARGSGKTSLVRVFGDYADQNGIVVIYMACEPGLSFAQVLRPYLTAIPAAALRFGFKDRFRGDVAELPPEFGPRAFVEIVSEMIEAPVVLIFDEFDRVSDPVVKADIAAAMKLLSDSLSSVLFMLVGIARNISDVVDSHPSLRRHMRVVSLGRIEPPSVNALIDHGMSITGMAFEPHARDLIRRAACGSPFHIRMFCHHASLAAFGKSHPTVREEDAVAGLISATELWARMNPEDATVFLQLANDTSSAPELEQLARVAAATDQLSLEEAERSSSAVALLTPALHPIAGESADLMFRDSTAPQFLIALIIAAEATKTANQTAG